MASRVSQSGQLAATFSFSTELRWRVFCRCCMTNIFARPRVIGSLKKRVRKQKSLTTESRRPMIGSCCAAMVFSFDCKLQISLHKIFERYKDHGLECLT